MDDRAREWMSGKARGAQGWLHERAESIPRPPWMQEGAASSLPGSGTSPTGAQVPPTVPMQSVPTPVAPSPTAPIPNPTAAGAHPMAPSSAFGATGPQPPERSKRRWPKRVLVGAALVGVLTMGACMGSIGSVESIDGLQDELAVATEQLDGATAERDELEALVAEQGVELGEAQGAADDLSTTLTAVEADLSTAQADLATMQTDLAAAQTTISERDATIAALQAELAAAQAAPAPVAAPLLSTPPAAAAPAPASSYYANCTAARNAGAAPVYAGQPGYGRHLDRDGDGVGCE